MTRFFIILFAVIVLLGSMVMIGLLGMGNFSNGEGFLRVCQKSNETKSSEECYWFWERPDADSLFD